MSPKNLALLDLNNVPAGQRPLAGKINELISFVNDYTETVDKEIATLVNTVKLDGMTLDLVQKYQNKNSTILGLIADKLAHVSNPLNPEPENEVKKAVDRLIEETKEEGE